MTALPAIALPVDPTPTPSRATESSGGTQFFSLVQNGQNPSSTANAAASSPAAGAAAPAIAGATGAPTKGAKSAGTDSSGTSGAQEKSAKDGTGTTVAVVIPLPVPSVLTQPVPTLPGDAGKGAAQTPSGVAAMPAAQGGSAASNRALLTAATALNAATGGVLPAAPPIAQQPASTPAAIAAAATKLATPVGASAPLNRTNAALNGNAITGNRAAPAPAASAAPNPAGTATASSAASPLPAMAATLSMRVAANAVVFVSQPRAALASFAPQTEPAQGKAGSDASNTAAAHDSIPPGAQAPASTADAAKGQTLAQAITGAAKESAGAAPSPGHDAGSSPTGMDAQASANATSTANAAATAQSMTPAPNSPSPPATAAASASGLPLPPQTASVQLALSLHQALKVGSDHIQLQLQPADLGAVAVKLNINHDGHVTMVVSADRSDTLNMLKQDASSLTQALRDAGLRADNSSLSFNLRGGYQFNQQQQQQSSYGGSPSNRYSVGTVGDLAVALPATSMRSGHSGSLDIHV